MYNAWKWKNKEKSSLARHYATKPFLFSVIAGAPSVVMHPRLYTGSLQVVAKKLKESSYIYLRHVSFLSEELLSKTLSLTSTARSFDKAAFCRF